MPNTARKTKITAGYALYFPWVNYLVSCTNTGTNIGTFSLRVPACRGNWFARVPVWVGKFVSRSIAHALKINGRAAAAVSGSVAVFVSVSAQSQSQPQTSALLLFYTFSLCTHNSLCVVLFFSSELKNC